MRKFELNFKFQINEEKYEVLSKISEVCMKLKEQFEENGVEQWNPTLNILDEESEE